MQVNSSLNVLNNANFGFFGVSNEQIKDAASKIDAKELTQGYYRELFMGSFSNANSNLSLQTSLFTSHNQNASNDMNRLSSILGGLDMSKIGYVGKPLNDLSQSEAKDLINEDGFFGVSQTAQRLSDFVIMASADDVQKLKDGKEGILAGFKQAEKIWGGKLPQISYDTIDLAIKKIDEKLVSNGENIVNLKA